MKYKTNIPALLMALLVFTTSNEGMHYRYIFVILQVHNIDFAFFTKADCGMEKAGGFLLS
jgi:hypothetical protein